MAKRILFTTAKYIGRFFELFFAAMVLYFMTYWLLSRIPVSGNYNSDVKHDITVYVTSNGVHTDFVVPIHRHDRDWGKELELTEAFKQDSTRNFIAIGWGDKNFFLKTKNWSDLTVGTALKATFGLGTGAVHVVQIAEPDPKKPDVIKLHLSEAQYKQLCKYIDGNLVRNNGKLSPITKHPYSKFDFFFDATTTYSLWFTCNSWTNSGLKSCEQPACVWTPFKDGIYLQYEK